MPAAAVIPAPIAYINVVAVKKLVVGFRDCDCGEPFGSREGLVVRRLQGLLFLWSLLPPLSLGRLGQTRHIRS